MNKSEGKNPEKKSNGELIEEIKKLFKTKKIQTAKEKRQEILLDEWKECRKAILKFDGLLIDLRKYGFTIIIGLLSAESYFFVSISELNLVEKFAISFGMFVLIYALFKVDRYYQVLLSSAVRRAVTIEKEFPLHLSFQISTYVERAGVGSWRLNLYYLLIIATVIALLTTTVIAPPLTTFWDENVGINSGYIFSLSLIIIMGLFIGFIYYYEKHTQPDMLIERQCERNRKAIDFEIANKRDKAILCYKANVGGEYKEDSNEEYYEGDYSYDRLAAIYREDGEKTKEIEVLEKAVKVFEKKVEKNRQDRDTKLKDFKRRLKKAEKEYKRILSEAEAEKEYKRRLEAKNE